MPLLGRTLPCLPWRSGRHGPFFKAGWHISAGSCNTASYVPRSRTPGLHGWWWWAWGSHQDLLMSAKCLLLNLTLSFHEQMTIHYHLPIHYLLRIYQLHFQARIISLLKEFMKWNWTCKILQVAIIEIYWSIYYFGWPFYFPELFFQPEYLRTFLLPSICRMIQASSQLLLPGGALISQSFG